MKEINELKQERSAINEKIDVILKQEEDITDEQRSETNELETRSDTLKGDIELLERQEKRNLEMASVNIITEPKKDDDDVNFLRAISEYQERDVISSEFAGKGGGLLIPQYVYRADPLLTSTESGIINKNVAGISVLKTPAAEFLTKIGVQRFSNLSANLVLPNAPQVVADFAGEGQDTSTGNFAPAVITLAPRGLGISQDWTREYAATVNPDLIQANLQAMFNAIDVAIAKDVFATITVDAGSQEQSHTSGALAQSSILSMEASLGFGPNKLVTTPFLRKVMKSVKVGTDQRMLWASDDVEGFDALAETVVPADHIFLGNFNHSVVAQFGDFEVIFDNITKAKSRKTVATLNALVDTGYANGLGMVWKQDPCTYL